jgi:cell division septal protein FtsQ
MRRQRQPVAGRRKIAAPKVEVPKVSSRTAKIAAGVAVIVLASAGGWWLYHTPVFALHGVAVEGNAVVSDETVRQVAALDGQSIVLPDFNGAEARLRAFPLIKDAKVTRDWPFGAKVTITERQAWGVWQIGDAKYVIDDEGVVLSLPAPQNAPLIAQTDAGGSLQPGDRVDKAAVAIAAHLAATAQQAIGEPVSHFDYSAAGGLNIILADNVRVSFGGVDNYVFKLAALYAVLQRAENEGMSVHAVDLRFGDRVAVE